MFWEFNVEQLANNLKIPDSNETIYYKVYLPAEDMVENGDYVEIGFWDACMGINDNVYAEGTVSIGSGYVNSVVISCKNNAMVIVSASSEKQS